MKTIILFVILISHISVLAQSNSTEIQALQKSYDSLVASQNIMQEKQGIMYSNMVAAAYDLQKAKRSGNTSLVLGLAAGITTSISYASFFIPGDGTGLFAFGLMSIGFSMGSYIALAKHNSYIGMAGKKMQEPID